MEVPRQSSLDDLPLLVTVEDGEEYEIDIYRPHVDDIVALWEHVKKVKILFADNIQYDLSDFTQLVMSPSTVVMTVDDVGIVYLTDVRDHGVAKAHYLFWDKKTAGRHRVIAESFLWMMDFLELQRLNIDIPVYAFSALKRARKLGLRLEGIRRSARLFNGKWQDELLFGILREELTDEAIEAGKLKRTEAEDKWYGLVNNDKELLTKVKEWTYGDGPED